MIAKRKPSCECGCGASCDKKTRDVLDCRWNCEQVAFAADLLCAYYFRHSFQCNSACLVSVQIARNFCYQCCKGAGFYENCARPAIESLSWMQDDMCEVWD